MEENLKALRRKLIYSSMRTILFTIPICLITDKWYKWMNGDYIFKWDMQNGIDNLSMQTIYCIVFFCLVFILSYLIETTILPPLSMMLPTINIPQKSKVYSNIILKTMKGVSFPILYSYINKSHMVSVHSEVLFIPVTLILWLIYANTIIAYLGVALIIIITVFFLRISNSLYHEYK
jgi:hypothetical protein